MQEVTENIYARLSSAPWWGRYAASPPSAEQPYYIVLLFRRDAVAASGPFRFARYANSCMGALRPRSLASLCAMACLTFACFGCMQPLWPDSLRCLRNMQG